MVNELGGCFRSEVLNFQDYSVELSALNLQLKKVKAHERR